MESYCEYTVQGVVKRYKSFSKLTEDTAYFIGHMACGGGYQYKKGSPIMSVNGTDMPTIEYLRDTYCPDNTIYHKDKHSSAKVKAVSDVWEICFPIKMRESFKKFGIFDYKRNRRIVGVSKANVPAYLAGCLDAGGFVTIVHRKDYRTPRLKFYVSHESEKFLADLQNLLFDTFRLSTTLRQHGVNVFRLQAQNTEQNKQVLSIVAPYLRNKKKKQMTEEYLEKFFVLQASGELLESVSQSAAKLSVHTQKVQRLPEGYSPLNNRLKLPNLGITA